jgi:YfiR/HmsC-like
MRHPAWRRLSRQIHLAAMTFGVALFGTYNLSAQAQKVTEYQVKAAYLANFGRFAEWPASVAVDKSESFNICVLGQDPFGADLDAAVAGETIGHTHVLAKRISRPQDAVDCRILFISSSEASQWKEILVALRTLSVLTVSDIPQFTRRGGIIQFLLDGNRVRFDINLAATERVGVKLSSELLKLAVTVSRSQ